MAELKDIILNNNWKSSDYMQSTDVNRLFNSGIVTQGSDAAQRMIQAVDYDNVQSTMTVGMTDYEWAEQNFADATDNEPTALEPYFDEATAKIFFGNQWWKVRGIQKDLMNTTQPVRLVLNKSGSYWATMWNRVIAATISGMKDIAAITVGDGTLNLSANMVIDARLKKGDMGWSKLAKMHMNSKTLHDILAKQLAGSITKDLVKAIYGSQTVTENGVTTTVTSQTPIYVYEGVVPIVVDDSMTDGIIALVEDAAFAFAQNNMSSPLMYSENPKTGGVGSEEWGTKALYLMHPVGFSFKGELGTHYANKTGLTLAELLAGGLYELKVDPKLTLMTNLRVKVG